MSIFKVYDCCIYPNNLGQILSLLYKLQIIDFYIDIILTWVVSEIFCGANYFDLTLKLLCLFVCLFVYLFTHYSLTMKFCMDLESQDSLLNFKWFEVWQVIIKMIYICSCPRTVFCQVNSSFLPSKENQGDCLSRVCILCVSCLLARLSQWEIPDGNWRTQDGK